MYIKARETLGQPPNGQPANIFRIIMIDPNGVFSNQVRLREEIRSRLEDKFNRLDPNWLKQEKVWFSVQYRAGMPERQEKAGFGIFDFPVYLLNTPPDSASRITDLMKEHGIPNLINNRDYYQMAQDCWKVGQTRGCGIPLGNGFKKVGFIKTYRVFQDVKHDPLQAFVNVIAHEVGHMGNLFQHSPDGLMKYPLPLGTEIDFNPIDKSRFLANLRRLRALKTTKSLNLPVILKFQRIFKW
jgi:hypothetical protein